MAEDLLSQHLQTKFFSILQEAKSDPNSPSLIISGFQSIAKKLSFMSESTTPTQAEPLYKLIDALSECRILVNRIQKDPTSKKGFFLWWITGKPLSKFLYTRKLIQKLEEIEYELDYSAQHDGNNRSSTPKLVIQQTYPVLDTSRIFGFESQAKKIEDWLIDNLYSSTEGLTAIGITGICGCGKTALAQKVFSSPRIQQEFSPRIWVCLSNLLYEQKGTDTRVRSLNYILEEIGYDVSELEYSDFSLNKLLEKLQGGLMGKRYLIVLDDVWRVDEWYADLGHSQPRGSEYFTRGLPKGSGGGVIVTSRQEKVIRRTVGDKYVIRLQPLVDDIIWEIFGDVVKEQREIKVNDSKLEAIKKDVIRNCNGLPLAARTLASVARDLL